MRDLVVRTISPSVSSFLRVFQRHHLPTLGNVKVGSRESIPSDEVRVHVNAMLQHFVSRKVAQLGREWGN